MALEGETTTENNGNIENNVENQNIDQNQETQNIEQTTDTTNNNVDDSNDYFNAIEFDDDFEVEELNEELAFKFLKQSKGLEVESFDDLLKPKEVNPYEDIFDDDDKAYLNFKKETGRSRKDFEALNANLDEIPKIDLARERVVS